MKQHKWVLIVTLMTSMFTYCGTTGAADQDAFIEEVIVTAQKREQRLQDTPVSVTVFTGAMIEELGLRQSVDITAQTPNFSVGYPNGDNGVPAPFIRGVGLNDFGVLNQGPIAAYVDEVYISSNAAQIFQLLDVERVEVLRGPQGTLYGRNASGGAINFISRKPGTELDGWARASIGNFGLSNIEGAIGGPLGDNAGVRFSLLKTDSDGWMKNGLTGNDQQGIDDMAWRLLLDLQPSDALKLSMNIHGGQTNSDSVQYRHLGVWDELGNQCADAAILAGQCIDILGYSENMPYTLGDGTVVPPAPQYDRGNYDVEAENDSDFWGISLTASLQVGDYLITSITAFDDMDDVRPEETDATPNDLLTGVLSVAQESFSQELRVSRDLDNWSWLAGLYYLKDEADDHTSFDLLRLLRPLFVGADCTFAPAGNPSGFCYDEFVYEFESGTQQEITSLSLYFDTSIDLTEAWQLSIGLRYTDEEIDHKTTFFFAEPSADNPSMPGFPTAANTDFNNLSGRLVLNYTMSEDLMFYGGITTGFKGGGIQSTSDGISLYDEENLLSFEAGFKAILGDGNVRFNGSIFRYDYRDLQVFAFVIVNGIGFSTITNAADAEIYGAELELQWAPVENLFVNLGLGLLNTEYKDFVIPSGDFSGNEITMSPELTVNGLIQYDVPLASAGTLVFQLDFNYQDEVFFDALNNPLLSEEDYWLYNARVVWTSPDEKWDVAAFGRNLGNQEYMVYAFDLSFFGFHEQMLGTPRSYGIEVSYHH